MNQPIVIVLVLVAVLAVAFVMYQRQQAQIALAQIQNSPRNQIGGAVGGLVSGALGLAGVG